MVRQDVNLKVRMKKIEQREPYQLQQIIGIMSEEISENGFTNRDYCLYAIEGVLSPELICYLEVSPTISDDDEIYPSFVAQKSLNLLYYGQQFEDVLINVLTQKKNPTIDDYILALNYYSKYDTFKDFG